MRWHNDRTAPLGESRRLGVCVRRAVRDGRAKALIHEAHERPTSAIEFKVAIRATSLERIAIGEGCQPPAVTPTVFPYPEMGRGF